MTAATSPSPRSPHPHKAGSTKRGKDGRIADIADPAMRQRLYDLSAKMLDKIEDILDVIAPRPLDDPRAPPVPPSILRWTANLMALWHCCPHEACRRARCCRRKPAACIMRRAPRVPKDVRKGVQALLSGRRNGLRYEEVRATARDEVAALELWLAQARMAPTPRRRTRGSPLVISKQR